MAEGLPVYTIYYNPSDYPDKYVVRRFTVTNGQEPVGDPEPVYVGDSIEVARDHTPPNSTGFARNPEDDPAIVESWM